MRIIDDRYQVLQQVARGGDTELLRVEDRLRPGTVLALKLLYPRDGAQRDAIANDFRVRAGLRHRGVGRVYELGTDPDTGAVYYTGEWIDGRPWDDVLGRADPAAIADLCADVCATLALCHARGLLHLDLKPDNLLVVDGDGGAVAVKVLDFGMARGRRRGMEAAAEPFAAPEMLQGRPLDERTDLYALGVCLLPPDRRPRVPGDPDPDAVPAEWPRPLATLVRRMIDVDPARRMSSARAVLATLERAGAVPARRVRELLQTETPFVGRDGAMAALADAYGRRFGAEGASPDGGGPSADAVGAVLVVGEPGAGKTRLLREFRASVATRPPVVVGGDPYAADAPWPPLGDPLARLWQRREVREGPGRRFGRALQAVIPGLRPPPGTGTPAPAGAEELATAVVEFLVACGELYRGTLFLDDLDRGDPLARRVLQGLLSRDDQPWLVVASAREELSLPRCEIVPLPGLDEAAIETLLRQRFGVADGTLVSRVQRVTGGNPAFVELLLRRLRVGPAGGPDGAATGVELPELEELETPADLAASIRERVAGLTPEQQGPLGLLALAGRSLTLEAAGRALRAAPDDLGPPVEALVDLGLVRRDGAGTDARYRLALEHHAAAIVDGLSAGQRRGFHEAMARLLEDAEDVEDLRELARHLVHTGDLTRAAVVLLRAGRQATARFDLETAEAVLRRAGSTAPPTAATLRAEIGLALGDLMVHQGRYRSAADAYDEVEGAVGGESGPDTRGRLALRQGRLALRQGDRASGLALLHRAVGYLEGTAEHAELAASYGELAAAFLGEDLVRARHLGELALRHLSDDAPGDQRAALHLVRGRIAALAGDYRTALQDVGRAVELFRAAGSSADELTALLVLAALRQDLGLVGPADEASRRAVELVERTGDRDQLAAAAATRADSLRLAGEAGEALSVLRRGVDEAVRIGNQLQEALCRMRVGRLLSDVGDPDGGQRALERAALLASAVDDRLVAGEARVWLAAVRLRVGDGEGLEELLDRAERDLEAVQQPRAVQSARVVRAALLLRRGYHGGALRELEELAGTTVLPEIGATMQRLLCRLERQRRGGDLATAYAHARQAVAEAERSGSPDARWRCLDELASVCVALGRTRQAEEILGQLQQLAEAMEQRRPADVPGSHRIHRAVGRLTRELGLGAEPAAPGTILDRAPAAAPPPERDEPLASLVDALRELAAAEGTARHRLEALLGLAVRVAGAERGALRLRPPAAGSSSGDVAGWSAEPATRADEAAAGGDERRPQDEEVGEIFAPHHPFRTPTRLLASVMRSGQATWAANASGDPRFSGFESVRLDRLRSVLCAPLRHGDRVEGVLYLDHPHADAAFGPPELRLVEAVAAVAALVARDGRLAVERQSLRARVEAAETALEALQRQGAEAAPAPGGGPPRGGPSLPAAPATELARPSPAVIPRGQLRHDYAAIVGQHPALVLALQTIDHVVDTDIPVYLHGDSGTGKELFARALHDHGPRADRPFMALNCAAVPEQLLESELFGHVRGAFTGATADRPGLFEMADGGTLFLDEVGDMSPAMQAKLLRVLQEGEVRRVGSSRTSKVDVRVLAASHRDLAVMVDEQEFRQDVYYRLCAITVVIPPLRHRRDDVPLLWQHFLAEEAAERGTRPPLVDPEVPLLLMAQDWPGNVRQLRNVVRTAWALGGGRRIGRDELALALGQPDLAPVAAPSPAEGVPAPGPRLPGAVGSPAEAPGARGLAAPSPADATSAARPGEPAGPAPRGPAPAAAPAGNLTAYEQREREAILAALEQTGDKRVAAARLLGMSRRTFYRRLDKYGIGRR